MNTEHTPAHVFYTLTTHVRPNSGSDPTLHKLKEMTICPSHRGIGSLLGIVNTLNIEESSKEFMAKE